MKISAIIVDDELHCIQHLSNLLQQHFSNEVEVIGSFQTAEKGFQAIAKYKPHVVFLDIQIHQETAFTLLQKLMPIQFEIIFTTAYNQYAVQAFRFCALDFLLKPIALQELKETISRVQYALLRKDELTLKIETLLHNVQSIERLSKKIIIPTTNGFKFLQLHDIIRFESNINYTVIYLKNKTKLIVAKTLKEFEKMLIGYPFFRIHNSHLIHLPYVQNYKKGRGGSVIMEDGIEIEVSTRRKEEFLQKLKEISIL
jgi:two-component system LytT family response regulator